MSCLTFITMSRLLQSTYNRLCIITVFLKMCGDFQVFADPNVIIFLADDLGWNDVSFHGSSQFMTPNIDALAYSGVILKDYYTQPICTPARAALLTGRHPIHNGMQHSVIYAPQPWGLPLSERLMSEYLRHRGYKTHTVGKWHLGHFKSAYTPTMRGFDSFYGSWLGHLNHFTHFAFERHPGYDWHRNLNISYEGVGRYDTDLFSEEAEKIINNHNEEVPLFLYMPYTAPHTPLQAPRSVINQFNYISDKARRKYAAMVTKLDESVGRVIQALKRKDMLENSIILFLSDNGGEIGHNKGNTGSNWPLKGGKDTLWEGGIRAVGLVWSPLLTSAPRVHRGLVNVQDWFPTILSVIDANQTSELKNLDGLNQWEAISNQATAPYNTMLHNIDPRRKLAALRYNQFKIVMGGTHNGIYDGWFGKINEVYQYNVTKVIGSMVGQALGNSSRPLPSIDTMLKLRGEATITCLKQTGQRVGRRSSCAPHKAPCLYNIEEDPCELNNIAREHPNMIRIMKSLLQEYHSMKPRNQPSDPKSFPFYWNNTWVPWQDFIQ